MKSRKPPKNFHETVGPSAKAAYIENPTKCPRCGHAGISGKDFTIRGVAAFQPMSCPGCHLEWTDIYRLTDIAITEPKP